MSSCPICNTPYGKRNRCYVCNGRKRTGENRNCKVCGKEFYAPGWVIADTVRNSGCYCSRECTYKAMRDSARQPRVEGKTYHPLGYVLIWMPEHPRAVSGGRVLEHIVVMEKKLGRPVTVAEHVHHKDHDPANNDPDNLEILTPTEHQRVTSEYGKKKRRSEKAEFEEYVRLYGPLELDPKGENQ